MNSKRRKRGSAPVPGFRGAIKRVNACRSIDELERVVDSLSETERRSVSGLISWKLKCIEEAQIAAAQSREVSRIKKDIAEATLGIASRFEGRKPPHESGHPQWMMELIDELSNAKTPDQVNDALFARYHHGPAPEPIRKIAARIRELVSREIGDEKKPQTYTRIANAVASVLAAKTHSEVSDALSRTPLDVIDVVSEVAGEHRKCIEQRRALDSIGAIQSAKEENDLRRLVASAFELTELEIKAILARAVHLALLGVHSSCGK